MDNQEISNFFHQTEIKIIDNLSLREPQKEGYFAILRHFNSESEPCYVQLPVGCGKTGLMGITPFKISSGRVLIVAPNLTIKQNIYRELDVSHPDCFYPRRQVFIPTEVGGPFISELKTGANIHDCDSAHLVVSNIQQFTGRSNKWYERFPRDYFSMILVDEGHHNVAESWSRLFQYFENAKIVSFTATPLRSDGQQTVGKRVYAYSYTKSMLSGFISQINAVFVKPEQVTFIAKGEEKTLTLEQVIEMRENDWFSKGIALSEQCNRHIVQASIERLYEVRKYGSPRQIIAVACSIRHANQVAALYREYGLKAEVLHSNLVDTKREEIEASLRNGLIDVIAQVNILGEGYDLGTLSVAAVFRPYRSLAPYIQFVSRILRLAAPATPFSPANNVYLVSHVGLNDERWWEDFTNFDKVDQQFFAEYLAGDGDEALIVSEDAEAGERTPRMTLRPFMRVLNETVNSYLQRGYLTEINETMIQELFETIRAKGFDPSEFGLTEEMARRRLELAAQNDAEIPAYEPLVNPQRRREALKQRLAPESRAIADTVINRLGLKHAGRNLLKYFPGKGDSNSSVLIALASSAQNKAMKLESGQRSQATPEQLEAALRAAADIADQLTKIVQSKLGE
jgi:superfamily II DNA or RNA helicase